MKRFDTHHVKIISHFSRKQPVSAEDKNTAIRAGDLGSIHGPVQSDIVANGLSPLYSQSSKNCDPNR